jgi:Subtilase family
MAAAHNFEYLPLVFRKQGPARFPRPVFIPDPQVANNRQNRGTHSGTLFNKTGIIVTAWKGRQEQRAHEGLPEIKGIPLLLKIDTTLDIDLLRQTFQFEIVSEEEDGFVIVASDDISLTQFQQKLTDFAGSIEGSSNVARVLDLKEDPTQEERLRRVLSQTLFQEWPTIADAAPYVCDVSIACTGTWEVPKKPKKNPLWKAETWARKEQEWSQRRLEAYEKWEQLKDQRLAEVQIIIGHYQAEIVRSVDSLGSEAATLPDSFSLRIKIVGKGLKDLVLTYPFVFEVAEPDDIELPQQVTRDLRALAATVVIEPADPSMPVVCVIDSGIQEEHLLLEPGIDKPSSRCFLPHRETDVTDYVSPAGHGTRVAGAILHGEEIPKSGTHKLEAWVQNARVLDDGCDMPKELVPPEVLGNVVRRYHQGSPKARIFNHSINADAPCRTVHMSAWAAEIDRLTFENDILVVQSTGNLKSSRPAPRLGIQQHMAGGTAYPDYLDAPACRLANPAQSLQALSVGSVGYGAFEDAGYRSFVHQAGEPSAFSRCGPGIWGAIKPEVVEYGGDTLRTAGATPTVSTPDFAKPCYPELVASTRHGSPAFDRDEVGTSFAAPKVTRIAARLQATLPDEPCLLYRALIVQSARWPEWARTLTAQQQAKLLMRIGYGIPDIGRASKNDNHRTTFISHGDHEIAAGACHVYQVRIPADLRRPADDYDILIEVTLSYAAEPRRTRRNPRGYLATWVDWTSSRKGELPDRFVRRAIKEEDTTNEGDSLGWTIENNPVWGRLPGVRRNIGTVQKDWLVKKSHDLPEEFCIAVRGHKGWSKDPDAAARYALAVSIEILGKEIPIYEPLHAAVQELQAEVQAEVEVETEVEVPE